MILNWYIASVESVFLDTVMFSISNSLQTATKLYKVLNIWDLIQLALYKVIIKQFVQVTITLGISCSTLVTSLPVWKLKLLGMDTRLVMATFSNFPSKSGGHFNRALKEATCYFSMMCKSKKVTPSRRDRKLRGNEQPVLAHPENWLGIGCMKALDFFYTKINELA